MNKQERLIGIDFFRTLAIFAVIILHIDAGVKNIPFGWVQIIQFASFCVPFFLATAFFLAISKIYSSQDLYPLHSRLIRLLIPYGIWSALYLLYKCTKYIMAGESSKLLQLFQDPLSLIFFGGSSFHLYFLPLLATGSLLIKLAEVWIKRHIYLKGVGLIALLTLLTLLTLLVYELVLISGNGLVMPANVAFKPLATEFIGGNPNPLLRWFLVELYWVLRCLPYIMVAMLLTHPTVNQRCFKLIRKYSLLCLLVFLVFNTFGFLVLPQGVFEVTIGYSALVAAIAVSEHLRDSTLIRSLGQCSFGIYLIHLLFVEIFQSVFIRLYPNYVYDTSVVILLLSSLVVFLTSWGIVNLLIKQKRLSQILFGS